MIKELNGFSIRCAAVLDVDEGYIYAGDIEKERNEVPYTKVFLYSKGVLKSGDLNYDAHSVCVVTEPELALVNISENGFYGIATMPRKRRIAGDIFEDSAPPSGVRRIHGVESVNEVAGKAYAVGLGGMVYRMDKLGFWARIDEGLPEYVNLAAISGFGSSELYAVGEKGELWFFDGSRWKKVDVPTNRNLLCVKCGEDGFVYIGCMGGVIIRGYGDRWEVFSDDDIEGNVWSVEFFKGEIFASTMDCVYCYRRGVFEIESFGERDKVSCYQISVFNGVMWSVGERDVMQHDGSRWSRVV